MRHLIDLRIQEHALTLNLDGERMTADDPAACQLVGEAAHHARFEALLAPSTTSAGDIAVVFLDRMLQGSRVRDIASTRWDDAPPL